MLRTKRAVAESTDEDLSTVHKVYSQFFPLISADIYVLDELVKQAGLSNAAGSTTQYIRIDGSTSPQERQNQIRRFQDPRNDKLRVAVLGITAAGVAVTLTASSTVWFAELFWTPALMIQAEDRVHR